MTKKRSFLSIHIFFSTVLLLSICGCSTFGTYNPATGHREFIAISTSTEIAMGRSIHTDILNKEKLSTDQNKIDRLNAIGERVASVSDRQDYTYHFYLIADDQINAFTIPGGNIYFYTGLFDKLQSDDEIAAVLAHEVGHCAAKHTAKRFQRALGYNLLSAVVMSQTKMNDKTKAIVSVAGNVGLQLALSAYSRKDEYEADKLGLKYMILAGYNPQGMVKTFELLQKESKGSRLPLILSTHPYIEDRIKVVKDEIPEMERQYAAR